VHTSLRSDPRQRHGPTRFRSASSRVASRDHQGQPLPAHQRHPRRPAWRGRAGKLNREPNGRVAAGCRTSTDPPPDSGPRPAPGRVEPTRSATIPANRTRDGDGVEGRYEYYSALDLHSNAPPPPPPRPYPAKDGPYPNALFPDAPTELRLATPHIATRTRSGSLRQPRAAREYSDGKQTKADAGAGLRHPRQTGRST